MNNEDIRYAIFTNNLKKFAVAEAVGVSAITFSRWLQTEMSKERKRRVMSAINKLIDSEQKAR